LILPDVLINSIPVTRAITIRKRRKNNDWHNACLLNSVSYGNGVFL
jgi:hypothetical protein